MKKLTRCLGLAAVLLLLLSVPLAPAQVRLTNDVAWVLVADAYKACVLQSYLGAMERLKELAAAEKPGTWCVILDADETVISNVEFQKRLQAQKSDYSEAAWKTWCEEEAAVAMPGAAEFCALVQKLGGKVIIVTNRKGNVKKATEANLKKAGIPCDVVLVREGAYALDRSKIMRRTDVEKGQIKGLPEGGKLPALKILMLCGDQDHDLYDTEKLGFEQVAERFGKDLVILPNPMYGDWAYEAVYAEAAAPAAGASAVSSPGAMTWQEAMKLPVGSQVTVEAVIVNVYDPEARGKTGPVKLNVDRDYRTSLTFVYYAKSRSGEDSGFPPAASFQNKKVRVTGEIGEHQEAKQIMLRSPSQIEIVK